MSFPVERLYKSDNDLLISPAKIKIETNTNTNENNKYSSDNSNVEFVSSMPVSGIDSSVNTTTVFEDTIENSEQYSSENEHNSGDEVDDDFNSVWCQKGEDDRPPYIDKAGISHNATGGDHMGWFKMKTGGWFRSWKDQYFILKGSHLFCAQDSFSAPHNMLILSSDSCFTTKQVSRLKVKDGIQITNKSSRNNSNKTTNETWRLGFSPRSSCYPSDWIKYLSHAVDSHAQFNQPKVDIAPAKSENFTQNAASSKEQVRILTFLSRFF